KRGPLLAKVDGTSPSRTLRPFFDFRKDEVSKRPARGRDPTEKSGTPRTSRLASVDPLNGREGRPRDGGPGSARAAIARGTANTAHSHAPSPRLIAGLSELSAERRLHRDRGRTGGNHGRSAFAAAVLRGPPDQRQAVACQVPVNVPARSRSPR